MSHSGRARLGQPLGGILLGTALVLGSMPLYVSFENRAILDRWSPAYVGVMCTLALAWVTLLAIGLRARGWDLVGPSADTAPGEDARLIGYGITLWGAGYACAAVLEPGQAARLLEADIAGSTRALPSLMEYAGLALLLVGMVAGAWRRSPDRLRNPLMMASSIIVLLLLLEGGARVKAFVAPTTHGFPTHSEAVWRARFIVRNSLGFRDVEHPLTAEPGTRRVAIIGDSYGLGWGLERIEDRFGEKLAASLSASTATHWEELNASRSDTHTLQHFDYLERILPYEPDVVVLLYVFNDIDYLSQVTPQSAVATRGGGLLGRLRPARLFFLNSFLFQEVFVRVRILRSLFGDSERFDPYQDDDILAQHVSDLARLVDEAEASGAVVRIIPFDIGVVASPELKLRYSRFVEALQLRGLDVCSLLTTFDGIEFADLVVNGLDAHPNARAHELAAAQAASCLGEAVAPRTGRVPLRWTDDGSLMNFYRVAPWPGLRSHLRTRPNRDA